MPVAIQHTSRILFLHCAGCEQKFTIHEPHTFAACEWCQKNPLISHYDLPVSSPNEIIDTEERSLWRYRQLLPVLDRKNEVTLGEGWTPLLRLNTLEKQFGLDHLLIKDESQNPTGSFKARGLAMAISKAKELGISECIIPTAGNAGGAMAAYCARAGMKATVVMPKHTPKAFMTECLYFGATLIQVEGLISDCAKKVAALNADGRYYDVSTLKEPYRLEGKKTLGYEIAEQLHWELPDVILYPTGGGTGLIGMWKAFKEMMKMGWIEKRMPRFIAVQSEQCQPVVETFHGLTPTTGRPTMANGLAVPFPFAARLIQRVLSETSGSAIAVAEEAILPGVKTLAMTEGLLVSPEGGALIAGLKQLLKEEKISNHEKILLLNTGSGYKYIENF
jgi:threonine synthase